MSAWGQRRLGIAALCNVVPGGRACSAPSQSGARRYTVTRLLYESTGGPARYIVP